MQRALINPALFLFFIFLQSLLLFVLPSWLLPKNALWGYLLVIPVIFSNSWWAFIHEAIHGCMFSNKHINRIAGRIHAIFFGSPFDLLRWGHLLHHAYSRTERERSEVYLINTTSIFWFKFNYYFRLLGGLYLFEVLGGVLLLLPRNLLNLAVSKIQSSENVVDALYRKVMEARTLMTARLDALLILVIYGIAFKLYGGNSWMLLSAMLARAFLISLVDNVFHYETPLEETRYARNLYLPAWLSRLILHFNLHGVHHLNPSVSCWQLPKLHAEHGDQYQGHWMTAIQAQLNGPIPIDAFNTSVAQKL